MYLAIFLKKIPRRIPNATASGCVENTVRNTQLCAIKNEYQYPRDGQ
jgi:hypothetical protein